MENKKLTGAKSWKYEKTGSSWYMILEDSDTHSWACSTNGLFTPEEELRIAKLIAAAPELLEALIGLNHLWTGKEDWIEVQRAINAINKATK